MGGEVLRDSLPPPRRQIVRCRDEQTPALTKGPQLHRAVGERAEAQRDVDALPHQIDALIGETEVDPDIGIAVLKGEDQPADMQDPDSRGAGYPDRAGRCPTRAPRLIAGLLDDAQ